MRCALSLKLWLGIATLLSQSLFCLGNSGAVSEWTRMFVPYDESAKGCDFSNPGESEDNPGDYFPYDYFEVCRQHLHIAIPSTDGPHPVFVWSHASMGVADLDETVLELITGLGYAVVSWESLSKLQNEYGLAIAEKDSKKVAKWLRKNRNDPDYNLDLSRVIIGGRSRGTIASWKVAHQGFQGIIGIYMYNALPGDIWYTEDGDKPWIDDAIDNKSPPIFLSYGPSCPHPIPEYGCTPWPDSSDIHNPENGVKVVAAYNELGLKSYMVDGLAVRPENFGVFGFLPYFVAALEADTFPESMPVLLPKDVYGMTKQEIIEMQDDLN